MSVRDLKSLWHEYQQLRAERKAYARADAEATAAEAAADRAEAMVRTLVVIQQLPESDE